MNQASTIEVRVNGEDRRFRSGIAVSELLAELGAAGKRVAVECNGEIVPRSRHATTTLASGDRIEVVIAVGGG
jgi:sulfur carrier protein